jgi:hypothetical protein
LHVKDKVITYENLFQNASTYLKLCQFRGSHICFSFGLEMKCNNF